MGIELVLESEIFKRILDFYMKLQMRGFGQEMDMVFIIAMLATTLVLILQWLAKRLN